MTKMGRNLSTTVGHYNNTYKELGKGDKDVVRISGGDNQAQRARSATQEDYRHKKIPRRLSGIFY